MAAVKLLDFTNTGAYAQHFPAIFHLDLSDGSYEFLQESVVSNFALPWKGCLWDLAESDTVSATSREIYKIANRKLAEKMDSVDIGKMYHSGKQLRIDSLLCLKAADGDGYIPVMFSMTYHYDPKQGMVTRAFGSIHEYTRPMISMDPNDRIRVDFVSTHAAMAMSK